MNLGAQTTKTSKQSSVFKYIYFNKKNFSMNFSKELYFCFNLIPFGHTGHVNFDFN